MNRLRQWACQKEIAVRRCWVNWLGLAMVAGMNFAMAPRAVAQDAAGAVSAADPAAGPSASPPR